MLKPYLKRSTLITVTAALGTPLVYYHFTKKTSIPLQVAATHHDIYTKDQLGTIIEKISPIETFHKPKNPVILCHGLSGFSRLILLPSVYQITKFFQNFININKSDQELIHDIYYDDEDPSHKGFLEIDYWIGVKELLESKGVTVFTAKVPPFGSIKDRATALNNFIKSRVGAAQDNDEVAQTKVKVNLIAHSMGGLDARYLISAITEKEKENYEVISLTTISTPHHGSVMANYVCDLFDDLKEKMGVQNPNIRLPNAFYELTTDYVDNEFNPKVKNSSKVKYFSYGAYIEPTWNQVFYLSWKVIDNLTKEPNDGLVTINSSKNGQFLGVLPNLDHLNIINWKVDFKGKNNPDELDILQFYLKVVDDLGKSGC